MSTRREFVSSLLGIAALAAPPRPAHAGLRIRALAIDGFVLFDPRPIGVLAERVVPGRGAALVTSWRTRQFEYTWLRAAMHRYVDFWTVTEEALAFAVEATGVALSASQRDELMAAYLSLAAYPDVRPALTTLKAHHVRLTVLTNLSPRMLEAATQSAGLGDLFERRLSTDTAHTYKPDPPAYRLAVDALGLPREEIGFVASAGWDAAGAKAYGFPTFWVNRPGQPAERLGVQPDGVGVTLFDLVAFLDARA